MSAETTLRDCAQAGEGFANQVLFKIKPIELTRLLQRGDRFAIVDVRDPEDFQNGHVPGATNLPQAKWPTLEGLRKDSVNVVYGHSAATPLATLAVAEFAREGFLAVEMDGGFEAWKTNPLPVQNSGPPSNQ